MARPDRTFSLLVGLSLAVITAIVWSAHHLLLAGAPAVAAGGPWPGLSCLLLPLADDFAPHFVSYPFLLAIAAGAAVGMRTLVGQYWHTRALLGRCFSARSSVGPPPDPAALRIEPRDRIDIVQLDSPVAFCHGLLHPRILVSTGLLELLTDRELDALLLHEREHLRQRDPLKVALGRLLVSTVFFLPMLGALYRRYLLEKELAADSAAIAKQGDSFSLSAALVRLADRAATQPAVSAGGGEALAARIDFLLGEPVRLDFRPGAGGLALSAILAALAAAPLFAAPVSAEMVASSHNIVAGCHLVTTWHP